MALTQLDPREIIWQKEGYLYKSAGQGLFEQRVIESVVRGMKPSYWGTDDPREGLVTFCDIWYIPDIQYVNTNMSPMQLNPFSYYPIFLEIDARKYLDRLAESGEGEEGIAIKGPIDLEDITILFATGIDVTVENYPFDKQSQIDRLKLSMEALREKFLGYLSIGCNLFSRLENDEDQTIDKILPKIPYGREMDVEQKIALIKQGIEVLRSRLC